MTPKEAAERYGGVVSDWRQLENGAVAHKDATLYPEAEILGPAVFRGGLYRGGVFYGGVFYGGEFRGGVFYGGVFYGGEFRGGVFYGGVFRRCILLTGALPWPVNIASPTEIAVGCQVKTLAEWKECAEEMAKQHHVDPELAAAVLRLVESLPADAWPEEER